MSRVPIGRLAAWSAKSQLPIGIFWLIKIPISRTIVEGPSAHNPDFKRSVLPTPRFGALGALWATTRLSVPTLPSRAHPQDYGRRHNSLKLIVVIMIIFFFHFPFFQKSKIFQNPKFQFFPKSLLLILLIRPAFRPAFFPLFFYPKINPAARRRRRRGRRTYFGERKGEKEKRPA